MIVTETYLMSQARQKHWNMTEIASILAMERCAAIVVGKLAVQVTSDTLDAACGPIEAELPLPASDRRHLKHKVHFLLVLCHSGTAGACGENHQVHSL